jgi:hypothetical protein
MAGIRLGDLADLYQRATSAVFGNGPSVSQQLATAFPQPLDAGRPGQTVAQAAPAPTSLTPQQMNLVSGLTSFGGILAGEGAATADLGALARAKGMAEAGHDAPSIWGQTGWYKGPEGKWKFEIDDSKAKLDALPLAEQKAGVRDLVRAPDTLQHPDLYSAYPAAENVAVEVSSRGEGNRGSFQPGGEGINPTMTIKSMSTPEMRSTALHEMQHAIQHAEGFQTGGNKIGVVIGQNRPAFMQIYRDTVDRMTDPGTLEDYAKTAGYDNPAAAATAYAEHVKTLKGYAKRGLPGWLDKAAQEAAQEEAYRRLAGEAEARAVQARADLTPEQRRATFPLDSYDVPLDQLIMRGIQVGR